MSTYSLLQLSLDQTISREDLEDASVVAPSVARADCFRLQRELFGILVSSLPFDEARTFQAELLRRGFPTEVVPDDEIPLLHEPFGIQRFSENGDILQFTDSLGRVQTRPLSDLVFLAGGHVERSRMKIVENQHMDYSTRGMPSLESKRSVVQESEGEFHLDFFFWTEPNRLRLALTRGSTIFYQNQPLRLRDTDTLRTVVASLRHLLPPERRNGGISSDTAYPSSLCYEEEIRWHFHRLKSPS